MILSVVGAISMWPLTSFGYTNDYFPPECDMENSMISTFFVFGIVGLYAYLFHKTLTNKNRQLRNSLNDLQKTTQKLVQSEKMASLGIMSAGVAHEINNPLNFIRGGIDMLSKQLGNSQETKPYIEAIDEGVNRASSIVNSLNHFSRENSSRDEICDIHEIINNCLVVLQHKLKFKIDVIKKYCDARPLRIRGNEGQLHQAILNIISNAIQAISRDGTITFETCTISDTLKLKITDTGEGISEENLSRISDPFFTTKAAGEGTGLGLSIAFKIIEDHNGSVNVESKLSEGTSFNISFENPQLLENG